MNQCKPTPGGYKAGIRGNGSGRKRASYVKVDERPSEAEEYQVHIRDNAGKGGIQLPSYDEPEYGPVTVTDGSGATIRVISIEEIAQRGIVRQGSKPVLVGHQRWIDNESIVHKL